MHKQMTPTEHKARHALLHNALDELLADWISQQPGALPSSPILDMAQWSHQQTEQPTLPSTQSILDPRPIPHVDKK